MAVRQWGVHRMNILAGGALLSKIYYYFLITLILAMLLTYHQLLASTIPNFTFWIWSLLVLLVTRCTVYYVWIVQYVHLLSGMWWWLNIPAKHICHPQLEKPFQGLSVWLIWKNYSFALISRTRYRRWLVQGPS